MAKVESLFATKFYSAPLNSGGRALNAQLRQECLSIAAEDNAGRAWSKQHGYKGYTSYASLNDLPERSPTFDGLAKALDSHAAAFIRALNVAASPKDFRLNSLWINVLDPGGVHTGHIHPLSVLSGTYYVDVPKGTSALKLEDPRLAQMMAAPPRKPSAPRPEQPFIYVTPSPGRVLMWESWLRHEVPLNTAKTPRISISFNYGWA